MKRILALICICLLLAGTTSCLAEEAITFSTYVIHDVYTTPGDVMDDVDTAAAALFFEYCLYCVKNDVEITVSAAYQPCYIMRDGANVIAIYRGNNDDDVLAICYQPYQKEIEYVISSEVKYSGMSLVASTLGCKTVDGNDWTDILMELLSTLSS